MNSEPGGHMKYSHAMYVPNGMVDVRHAVP